MGVFLLNQTQIVSKLMRRGMVLIAYEIKILINIILNILIIGNKIILIVKRDREVIESV